MRRIFTYMLGCSLCLQNVFALSSLADTPSEIAEKVTPSVVAVVSIEIGRESEEVLRGEYAESLGSGFVVRDGLIVTNYHVIRDARRAFVNRVGGSDRFQVNSVVAVNKQADLAILSVNGLDAPPLTLGDSEKVKVGDSVYVIGNPRGLEGTFSAGIVSGIRQIDNGVLIQVTAPISRGSSGGPVVNDNGEVVGIAVATLEDGQNLNFAIPASYLRELEKKLDEPSVTEPQDISAWLDHPFQPEMAWNRKTTDSTEDQESKVEIARLRDSAEHGDADAMYELGRAYHKGLGILRNDVEAAQWYRKAADAGQTEAMLALGHLVPDNDASDSWYREAANAGNTTAMLVLAYMSDPRFPSRSAKRGELTKDASKAAHWYRMAAEHDDPASMDRLAEMFFLGEGVPRDQEEATQWWKRAVATYKERAAEDPYLFAVVGRHYALGHGVERDMTEAERWFLKATQARLHFAVATDCLTIGRAYEVGDYVAQDFDLALSWYKKAWYYAIEHLGRQPTVSRVPSIAALSSASIANLYSSAFKNDREALRWLRVAAECGFIEAMFNLGIMYSNGEGAPQDEAEAYIWFSLAAAFGCEESDDLRDACAQRLTPQVRLAAQRQARERFEYISKVLEE